MVCRRCAYATCNLFQKAKLLASKKAEGNDAFKQNHAQKAYDLYSEALGIDPNNRRTNAKLFCNRALVGSKVVAIFFFARVPRF